MAQSKRVSLSLVEPDEMISKRGEDWLRDFTRLESIRCLLERGDKPSADALAQRTAIRRRDGVARLGLCNHFELLAFHDAIAKGRDAVSDRCAVRGRDCARNGDHRNNCTRRLLKIFLVLVVIVPDVRFRHRDILIGNQLRAKRDVGHLCGVARVLPDCPETLVAQVDIRGDLLEQLLARNLIPVIGLELKENALLSR